jgi:hypothetical protein
MILCLLNLIPTDWVIDDLKLLDLLNEIRSLLGKIPDFEKNRVKQELNKVTDRIVSSGVLLASR